MNCVLLKMGGAGTRFGSYIPKQFYEIKGEPLFAYILRRYLKIEEIDKYILVTNQEWWDLTAKYSKEILGTKLLGIVNGGKTNLESAKNGIDFAREFLGAEDILLIHDVTDPIVNSNAIREVICEAKINGCAAVITEQVHTLYKRNKNNHITGTIEKNIVGSGYSPEAFEYHILKTSFEKATNEDLILKTSVMELVQSKGISGKAVVSHQLDLKITYKEDMNSLMLLIENGEKLYEG